MSSAAHSWSNPPPGAPLDYAPPEPPYTGPHPLKRGAGAFLTVVGVILFSPVILAVAVGAAFFLAITWCFDASDDYAD